MLKNFRTYQIAISFHKSCRAVIMPDYLKDQLLRASSSVALNVAEGSGRSTHRDQQRFYFQALGSLRESQALLDLSAQAYPALSREADMLGGHLFRLCHPK